MRKARTAQRIVSYIGALSVPRQVWIEVCQPPPGAPRLCLLFPWHVHLSPSESFRKSRKYVWARDEMPADEKDEQRQEEELRTQ